MYFAVQCAQPLTSLNVSIEGYSNYRVEGSQMTYTCKSGLQPTNQLVSNCTNTGEWLPDPSELICQSKYLYIMCV